MQDRLRMPEENYKKYLGFYHNNPNNPLRFLCKRDFTTLYLSTFPI
jgi:hypothetical protein